MELSSEVFVMFLFIIGLPLFFSILRDRTIPEHWLFMLVYFLLTLSNIFTVVEEFRFEKQFNLLEHCSISLAAVTMLTAVIRLSRYKRKKHVADSGRESEQ